MQEKGSELEENWLAWLLVFKLLHKIKERQEHWLNIVRHWSQYRIETTCQLGAACALIIETTPHLTLSSWRAYPVTPSDFEMEFGRTPQNGCSSHSNAAMSRRSNDCLRTAGAFRTKYHHSIHRKF